MDSLLPIKKRLFGACITIFQCLSVDSLCLINFLIQVQLKWGVKRIKCFWNIAYWDLNHIWPIRMTLSVLQGMTGNRLPIQLPFRRAYRRDLCCTLGLVWIYWGWTRLITLCRERLFCPSPYICPLQMELLLESVLNNSLNEEIIVKKSYRDTVPLAFHVSLEVNWASPAQHVESKNGDCSFAWSKTVLLMPLPPYGHKYSFQKHTMAPEFISQQAPGSTILWSWLWLQLVEAWPICSIDSRNF